MKYKVVSFNCQTASLSTLKHDIKLFLSNEKPSILILLELNLTSNSFTPSFPGYFPLCFPHPSFISAGIVALVSSKLMVHPRHDLFTLPSDFHSSSRIIWLQLPYSS